jgi:hypothetical protein
MSDTGSTSTVDASPAGERPDDVDHAHPEGDDGGGRDAVDYLQWVALVVLALLALVATFRFYTSASRAIGIWIASDFEPIFQAAFNLAVLLAAAAGISVLARRIA